MTETMLTTAPATTPAAEPVRRATLVKGAAAGIGMAVLANVGVYLAGDAGGPIRVVTGWEPDGAHLGVGDVIVSTIALAALGTAALWAFEHLRTNGFREWAAVAALVAVVSIFPVLRLDIDAGSKVALSIMHLVTGAAAIVGHVTVRRLGETGRSWGRYGS